MSQMISELNGITVTALDQLMENMSLLKKPPNSGSLYYSYKDTFSIVLMAVVYANYQFLMVDVGANGRVSDGGVLYYTRFWEKFQNNTLNIPSPSCLPNTAEEFPYVFVGDEAFLLQSNLMKLYSQLDLTNERFIIDYPELVEQLRTHLEY